MLIEKYLGEATSKYKREFIKYAYEIIENFVKVHPDMLGSPETFQANAKQLQVSIVTVMGTMSQPNGAPAYALYKKYMPKKYNKFLFDNGEANSYDSEWFSMTDDKHFTIAREATLEYAKKNKIPLSRKDIMVR
jgi:hypothetical protein